MNIFLKKDIVEMKNVTSEGLMVYVGLVVMSQNKIDKLYTSVAAIETMFKMSFKHKDRGFKDKIKRGLVNLKDNKVIDLFYEGKDFKVNEPIIIKLNEFKIDTNNGLFMILNVEEIIKITTYTNQKIDIDKLLKYFVVLVSTINNKSKVGFTTIDGLADRTGVSDNIIKTKYNNILEELKIIYIHRHSKSVRLANGEIRKLNNTYGRYEDKNLIIKNANAYDLEVESNNMGSNEARSIKQRYNILNKKITEGLEVAKEDLDKINVDIMRYNDKYKNNTDMIPLSMLKQLVI